MWDNACDVPGRTRYILSYILGGAIWGAIFYAVLYRAYGLNRELLLRASLALAETLGSTAANLVVDRKHKLCVGLEINANHVRAMRSGQVIGRARPLHLGGTTQVWEIRISNDKDQLVCVSRITMVVLDRSSFSR